MRTQWGHNIVSIRQSLPRMPNKFMGRYRCWVLPTPTSGELKIRLSELGGGVIGRCLQLVGHRVAKSETCVGSTGGTALSMARAEVGKPQTKMLTLSGGPLPRKLVRNVKMGIPPVRAFKVGVSFRRLCQRFGQGFFEGFSPRWRDEALLRRIDNESYQQRPPDVY